MIDSMQTIWTSLFSMLGAHQLTLYQGVMAFLPLMIALPTAIMVHHLLQRNKSLAQERDNYKILLNMGTENYCWWLDTDVSISCTSPCYELLNLSPNRSVCLSDLLHKFSINAARELELAVQSLHVNNQSFRLTVSTLEGQRTILIVGSRSAPVNALLLIDITNNAELNMEKLKGEIRHLNEENEILQRMIDTLPLALWYRNELGEIQYCNQAYAGALELTPEEVVQHGSELIEKKRAMSPYHLAKKARESGEKKTQRAHLVIDGQRRLLELCETPLREIQHSVGYAIDLTEMEEVSRNLSKHISAHNEVLQNVSTPIAVYGPDTRLLFFNSAYKKLFQFDESYLHSKPSYGDVLQDMRERRKLPECPDFPAFKRGQFQLFKTLINPQEELIHQPDDHILRQLITPHPLGGLLMMFDDVTDKLALERRYNTLIAVQKETLDHLYEGIIVFGSDNRLRLSNPALAAIWNLEPGDLTPGRHVDEIFEHIKKLFLSEEECFSFRADLLSSINKRESKTGTLKHSNKSVIQYAYVPLSDGSHLLSLISQSNARKKNTVDSEKLSA